MPARTACSATAKEEKIIPAVQALQARGWQVEGPLPADTLFFRAGRGDFDVVVAMYHDRGPRPGQVMGLEAGVNITVGLPVIRTSVDHGTAFDIAGKGIADERSMLEALRGPASWPRGASRPGGAGRLIPLTHALSHPRAGAAAARAAEAEHRSTQSRHRQAGPAKSSRA